MKIDKAVKALLEIVEQLHTRYPKKKFTLDGRLVGDIGEILVEQHYDVELYDKLFDTFQSNIIVLFEKS